MQVLRDCGLDLEHHLVPGPGPHQVDDDVHPERGRLEKQEGPQGGQAGPPSGTDLLKEALRCPCIAARHLWHPLASFEVVLPHLLQVPEAAAAVLSLPRQVRSQV